MPKFQCLLFPLKQSYIRYYIIYVAVPLDEKTIHQRWINVLLTEVTEVTAILSIYWMKYFIYAKTTTTYVFTTDNLRDKH